MKMYRKALQVIWVLIASGPIQSLAQNPAKAAFQYPELVCSFYAAHQGVFWLGNNQACAEMRRTLLDKLDSAANIGSNREKYGYAELSTIDAGIGKGVQDTGTLRKMDMQFTDAAISYCKDLYQGTGIETWLKYDEWSSRYSRRDNDFILYHLTTVKTPGELQTLLYLLEPHDIEYMSCKNELCARCAVGQHAKVRQLAVSLNFYRWIHHFGFKEFITVNVAAATLRYYLNDTVALFSRMVVGKPSTRTPRFAASCRNIILYPYWNVPPAIALKELVPRYKKSPALFEKEHMQVLDARDSVLDPTSIVWSRYGRSYFPYRLRQVTGCDNSLGVIKFDLTDPFDVYLHDTNARELFRMAKRYRSHGCMRVEKAVELGNFLLENKLDTMFLKACVKGVQPMTV